MPRTLDHDLYPVQRCFNVFADQRVATDFLQFWIGQTDARGRAGQRAYLVPSLECLPCRLKPNALAGSNDQYARHVDAPCKDSKHRAANLERKCIYVRAYPSFREIVGTFKSLRDRDMAGHPFSFGRSCAIMDLGGWLRLLRPELFWAKTLPLRLPPTDRGDCHMIRSVLAVATVMAIAIGMSAAIAQEDPIKARKALMKANGDQAKIGAAMIKGDKPFDLAAVHKIFAAFEDAAAKMPALFPDRL